VLSIEFRLAKFEKMLSHFSTAQPRLSTKPIGHLATPSDA
jgi:hypothetical protein